jgi:hypothetical protein
MIELFDPSSFGPRPGDRRTLTPYRHHRPPKVDLFDVRTFGPQPGAPELSRWRRDWHRHARWLASLYWPERLVVIIGEIAAAYLCLVFGMLVGVGLFG